MQNAVSNPCTRERDVGTPTDEPTFGSDLVSNVFRRWARDIVDWLDRYWDDPELRSGFWRSGW